MLTSRSARGVGSPGDAPQGRLEVEFQDSAFAPTRVTVAVRERAELSVPGNRRTRIGVSARAAAFDRMATAARSEAGLTLLVTSGYRSDAEQAKLFAARPIPHLFRGL